MPSVLPDPLSKETIERMFVAWRKPLDRGENLLILSAPYRDRAYRIPEFVHWLGKGYNVQIVSLAGDKIEDSDDWKNSIERREIKSSRTRVCVIVDAEHLLTDRRHLLQGLAQWHLQTAVPLILFSELYPYTPLPQVLMQNRYFHRLYDAKDMRQFLSYLEMKFKTNISEGTKMRIVDCSGGHLWLAKEVVRYQASGEAGDPFHHDELTWRVEQLYQGFAPREQEVLQMVALRKSIDDKEASWYLEKTGVVHDGRIAIGLLEGYVKQRIHKSVSLRVDQGKIIVGNICIDEFLSEQEKKAIQLLLASLGVTVSREQLGKAIWGEDGDFTDWALDQAVKRLRQKFLKFGIPDLYLRTVKGKGYYVPA